MPTYTTVDVVPALVKAIALDPVVYALMGHEEHVYGAEVDLTRNEAEKVRMGHKGAPLVLVQYAGGPSDLGYARFTRARVDVRSYGSSMDEAGRLALAVKDVLKQMHSYRIGGVLIHNAYSEAGFSPFREPAPMDWPGYLQPWIVTYNEVSGYLVPAGV